MNDSQESALQLRNIVKQLFESAFSNDVTKFENIASEFSFKSSRINLDNSEINLELIGAIRDGNDASLLHIASAGCNINVIKWLLDKCPDLITSIDKRGQTPIFYAIQNQNPLQLQVVNLMLPYSDLNKCDFDGNSLLHIAIKYEVFNTIKFLINSGCNINTISTTFGTPISLAVISENIEIVKLLLDSGADLTIKSNKIPVPPLIYSSAMGNIEMVKLLLNSGADVNETDSNGWSALHSAAEYGHFELVKLLISYGANVNYIINNATPYHLSLSSKNQELIDYLKNLTDVKLLQLEYHQLSLSEAIEISQKARLDCKDLIKNKEWNVAKSIYLQTIQTIKYLQSQSIKDELALLYSNLSLVYLSLNEFEESVDAGLKSIENNPKWIKGHYRTAMAYKALNDNVNYLCYLYQAAKIEGENGPLWRDFTKEADRIRNLKN